MSKLTLNVGGMFSGKSSELIRQGERHILANKSVIYLKPDIDTRYGEHKIVTHKGNNVRAVPVAIDDSIKSYITSDTDVVLIDEVQFFKSCVIDDILELLKSGVIIYASGLDLDFRGQSFNTTANLMALADEVHKFHAVCSHCGADAVHSAKIESNSTQRVEVGEKDKYFPLCRCCYYKFMDN